MVQAAEEVEQPDLPQAVRLLKEMNMNIQQVTQLVDNMLVRVKTGEVTTDKGATSEDDPQSYHANPSNLVSKIEGSDAESSDSSEEGDSKKDKGNKSNIYVPPKLAAVHYDDSISRSESEKKNKEKSRKQFLNSSVMRELRDEYSDAPVEVSSGNQIKQSISKHEQEKTEYEENYLTRLPVTKAEKNRRRKLTTVGMLADEITGRSTATRKHKLKSKKGKGFKRRRTH
ncbi:hypothetical protein ABMA27_013385 [Loxostege sticticalis]|uniref:Uncharacterized protein n=1 Tax=Loxostege sticticalis TaxID=481309 RepID=A0ABR3IF17_LOXSC